MAWLPFQKQHMAIKNTLTDFSDMKYSWDPDTRLIRYSYSKFCLMLCISNQLTHACAWVRMVENDEKHRNHCMCTRGLQRKTKKKVCWSAIGSDSQKLVDTLRLVAHLEFCCFLYFFLHEQRM